MVPAVDRGGEEEGDGVNAVEHFLGVSRVVLHVELVGSHVLDETVLDGGIDAEVVLVLLEELHELGLQVVSEGGEQRVVSKQLARAEDVTVLAVQRLTDHVGKAAAHGLSRVEPLSGELALLIEVEEVEEVAPEEVVGEFADDTTERREPSVVVGDGAFGVPGDPLVAGVLRDGPIRLRVDLHVLGAGDPHEKQREEVGRGEGATIESRGNELLVRHIHAHVDVGLAVNQGGRLVFNDRKFLDLELADYTLLTGF